MAEATQSLTYTILEEVKALVREAGSFNDIFKSKAHQHPLILLGLLRGDVSAETVILLDECVGFFRLFDKTLKDDPVWLNVRNKCDKYRPFLKRINTRVDRLSRAIRRTVEEVEVTC